MTTVMVPSFEPLPGEFYRQSDLCARLGLSAKVFRLARQRGALLGVKRGKVWIYDGAVLRAWLTPTEGVAKPVVAVGKSRSVRRAEAWVRRACGG